MFFLILLALLLTYFWYKKKYSFWSKLGFPSIPGKIPLGISGEMSISLHSSVLLKRFYDENKGKAPGVGMYMMTRPVLLTTEPELVKDILVTHFEFFHDRGIVFNEKDDPLSANLFMLSGQKWKDLRKKMGPTFTSGKMKMMFGTVSSICDRVVAFVKPSTKTKRAWK